MVAFIRIISIALFFMAYTSGFFKVSTILSRHSQQSRIARLSMTGSSISPQHAFELMSSEGVDYIDVRTENEFSQGHPDGSICITAFIPGPLGMSLNPNFVKMMEESFPKDKKLIIGCQAGSRSSAAIKILSDAGFLSLYNVEGGYGAWARDDTLPVSR